MINLFSKSSGTVGIWLFLVLTLSLTGCGAGRTMVLAPAETPVKFTAAELYEDKATVNVPGDVSAAFQAKLTQLLYGQEGFSRGPGLTIRYRFIQFNPGSQFTRWFWGGFASAGKGTMTVEARFLDGNGTELARIQSEAEVTAGVFGGPFEVAIQKTAEEVAEYAKRFR